MMRKADWLAMAGIVLFVVGSMFLSLAVPVLVTTYYTGLPSTTTPTRTLVLALAGFAVGVSGYRIGGGTWKGSWQVPLRAVAVGCLLLLFVFVRQAFAARERPMAIPIWIAILAVAVICLWFFARPRQTSKRKSRHRKSSARS
jgi:hypothetical protein